MMKNCFSLDISLLLRYQVLSIITNKVASLFAFSVSSAVLHLQRIRRQKECIPNPVTARIRCEGFIFAKNCISKNVRDAALKMDGVH